MATGYAARIPRPAVPPCPVVCPYIAAIIATLAVGRSTPSSAATGRYMSVAAVAVVSAASPETAASTRGSICPRSARTKTCPGWAITARRSTAGPGAAVLADTGIQEREAIGGQLLREHAERRADGPAQLAQRNDTVHADIA